MRKNITAIILAGGKSSRMGTDKGTIIYNDKTFTQNIIDNIGPYVDEVIIVSNSDKYNNLDTKVIPDNVRDFGPVAGIYSGLKESKTDYNLVISCDSPKVDIDALKPLIEQRDNKHDIIQYICNSKTTPLIALYNKKCLNIFKLALRNKIHKLRFVIKQLETKTLVAPDNIRNKIVNINTPKDLERYNIC
ncbi:molybdenum cofactor guanylyltransferase [Flavobacteriaceae bacterium]|nr:molybdenum cofactor guanylyltransferase [Flavobacteriaceae bacterium]